MIPIQLDRIMVGFIEEVLQIAAVWGLVIAEGQMAQVLGTDKALDVRRPDKAVSRSRPRE